MKADLAMLVTAGSDLANELAITSGVEDIVGQDWVSEVDSGSVIVRFERYFGSLWEAITA